MSDELRLCTAARTLDADATRALVRAQWEFVGGRVPVPKFDIRCPVCGAGHGLLSYSSITYSQRYGGTLPCRAEPAFKCCACSAWWRHAIPVDREVFDAAGAGKKVWRRREIEDALEAERLL
jgi:hypothetical protein